ncbi:hypothetical protein [Paenibacillus sp. FSL R7-0337]|uniref:hypothetical protein n=1 Tax=Paenibacillus sp. FSL R7-0337 TaxID=1926588 RepID=UPI00096F8F35|nr:hypothetical protein [Paenibacillus sp. FSL R7-0337]OMF96833.1 hypothetical protein BK147_11725 [Paenibacillus sp. FSL R7-0337]
MQEDLHTNTSIREQLLKFLNETFNYDGTTYLLAVSARGSTGDGTALESNWRLRVALTYRENDTTVNPYWDGTELEIALTGENICLLDEASLADEPPIIEGSPNALALEWVSEIAVPLWVSDEAREAAAKNGDEATRVEEQSGQNNSDDPFADFFSE